ncbi:MAG TPA: FAD-dependent oxidoreductase [Tepidisphaeraceae bacterium]|jgi:glycine/D-amino acid oxidase-like deaminating enzyme/nitrite reductase/ring-hydroxylating ferredoxin subunit|nr:FAD-dependent oxidoreductase [Tepidisphaeraceae bacterium]
MKPRDGITRPNWYDTASVPQFTPPPPGETHADVVIVGAGISGLTTAYLLAKEGQRVIVLDEGPIASGQTGRTSAHLASENDDRFYEIERMFGEAGAKVAYESHAAAIDLIEQIARDEKIDCDFARVPAYLFSLPTDPPDILERETAAAHRAGLTDAQRFERITLCGYETGPCIRFGNQGRFHPLKYIAGLAQAAERLGVQIYTGCRVTDVSGANPSKGEPVRATIDTGGPTVTANAAVVATNTPSPINDWLGIYTKQAAYRTYMVGLRVRRGLIDDALYWDTGDPYHYVRLQGQGIDDDYDVLLVGGEDHKTGQMPPGAIPFKKLEDWAREKFPMVEDVVYRWSGQVQEPSDALGYIGRAPTKGQNVFVITGDSGMGLTHGTLGAKLVTDLIRGRENPWTETYDPTRKPTHSLGEYVSENLNTAAQYVDLVTGSDVPNEEAIAPNSGAVMRDGLSKTAVHRDNLGQIHKCSALCTHLKGVVQWNEIEQTWDCPAHGSRFDPKGKVVMGPAVDDLPKA